MFFTIPVIITLFNTYFYCQQTEDTNELQVTCESIDLLTFDYIAFYDENNMQYQE